VQVKQTLDYAEFWDILETNLRERHDTRPTHTLAQFSRLRELVGEERVSLWGGYLDGRLIAGVVLFIPNKQATHAQYIASRAEFSRFCALNAVLSQIIKWSAENRFKYFNLGMATENAGRDMNEGLIHFKEGFGARGVLRETMALTLKPAAPVEQATRPARLP
jgi:lipid II:glycine glycyltransferase (peptidoglycan interpeptide bridge formation enzyme)